jgi:peptidoglycan-associated lipoprotein
MRTTHSMLIALAAVGLAACSHQKPAPETAAKEEPPAPAAVPAPAPPAPAQAVQAPADTSLQDLDSSSIYFDFDKFDLNPDAQQTLSKIADTLQKHPEATVRIEGNCDERGTTEYNLALGQRRADAGKRYLVQLGVSEGRLRTVSYGKERPRALGHDEASWRENRRDDFHRAAEGGRVSVR